MATFALLGQTANAVALLLSYGELPLSAGDDDEVLSSRLLFQTLTETSKTTCSLLAHHFVDARSYPYSVCIFLSLLLLYSSRYYHITSNQIINVFSGGPLHPKPSPLNTCVSLLQTSAPG